MLIRSSRSLSPLNVGKRLIFLCEHGVVDRHAVKRSHLFGSSSCNKRSLATSGPRNPFAVLGVPVDSSFDHVRRAFVQLALKHHPDRETGSAEEFVRIREAFEAIVDSGGEGNPHNSEGWSQEELREWFHEETGDFLAFDMSEATRKEVIHVYNTMSQGGKDKGGYWEMARQLAEREQFRGSEEGPRKQIAGGLSVNRRKRRR